MRSTLGKLALILVLPFSAMAQQPSKKQMQQLIDENMQFAVKQYKVLQDSTPANRMPRTFAKGRSVTSDTEWWCSGFYPGTLWYLYEYTKDANVKAEAERRLAILEKEKRYTGNHDIGFMIYCSFGNAYRITGDKKYKEVIDTAAVYQITRYRPSIHSIQSWNKSKNLNCPVIIDNMMNLEQLLWTAEKGGDKKFREIAITHANTTLKNHYRPDHSTFHIVDYDLSTGGIIKKVNGQGAHDTSAWSRGQAWGLYGYTMMYRFTKDKTYLDQAQGIAAFILNHPNLPADKIPYWDYNAPQIPTSRDASAGAIAASALLELGQYVGKADKAKYVDAAVVMLQSLSSDAYRAKLGENGGFLLKNSVGHFLANSEVDVPLTYADYYFLEGLLRYKKWYL
ncbi:glycoside hydrolase family 88 protein [Chitinophaga niabensis]|uniref:Glycosyl Hydrolase Family 88 n=1 Tax=Chitinophaga niabensis TaxID=536979 RepID=A0A1N6K9V1_9BACT|nr:glycoside hydrolase family 88 protein [Chitinophaga niabensis]SIO53335.1 Glycosyl Hydrolase Family 88 [Chitinophaga niabensis]